MIRSPLILLILASVAAADPISVQSERTLVVAGQGYFPVALRLKDGRIAVVLRGGGPHLSINGRLDIVFSADEGKTWSKPTVVIDSPVDDRNPAFGQAADGALVVAFWRTARYDDQGRYNDSLDKPVSTWVTRSLDDGKNWTKPSPIDVADIGWGSPYGRIITRPDGSMLMDIYGGVIRSEQSKLPARDYSYLYKSTDNGQSWSRLSTIGVAGFNETAVIALPSGRLLAGLRADGATANIRLSHSDDGGKTWSPPVQITSPQAHPADFLLLGDGRILLTTGYRAGPFGIHAAIGDANGHFDWTQHFALSDDAVNGDCGYPSNIALADGRILTFWYATGSKQFPQWGTHCEAIAWTPPRK